MYKIEYDKSINRINVVLTGNIDTAEAAKYSDELINTVKSALVGFTLLVDTRGLEKMSDETIAQINKAREHGIASKKIKKSAIVADNIFVSSQSKKSLAELENAFEERAFASMQKAEDFLNQQL